MNDRLSSEIEDLVAQCIERYEVNGDSGVNEFLVGNELANDVRERLAILARSGLLTSSTTPNIEGYELAYRIGVGGMGEVWAAHDLSTGAAVAIKTIRGDLISSPRLIKRLQREAATLSRLNHPVIVPITDSGENTLGPWFAMPRVLGVSLDDLRDLLSSSEAQTHGNRLVVALAKAGIEEIDREAELFQLDYERAVARIGADIADALVVAHGKGILHRDIKPSNILLTPHGEIRLIDFGLARDEHQSRMTATESPLGSLAYMPPEQRAGIRDLDETADLHALGATLHELITGAPPSSHSSKSSSKSGPDIALPLRGIGLVIEASVRSQRQHRYQSAAAFRNDLNLIVAGQAPKPPKIPWHFRAQHLVRSQPLLAVLLALGIGALLTWSLANDPPQGPPPAAKIAIPEFSASEAAKMARLLSAMDAKSLKGKISNEERLAINQAILDFYRPFLEVPDEDIPEVALIDASNAMRTLARINNILGKTSESKKAIDNGLRAYRERVRRGDQEGHTLADYAKLEWLAGGFYQNSSQFELALKHLTNATRLYAQAREKLHPARHALLDRRLTSTLANRASVHELVGDFKRAAEVWDEAIAIVDANPKLAGASLTLRGRKMVFLRNIGRIKEADSLRASCTDTMVRLLDNDKIDLGRSQRLEFLRIVVRDMFLRDNFSGENDRRRYGKEIVDLCREEVAADPDNVFGHLSLALALCNLGAQHVQTDPQEAAKVLNEALGIVDSLPSSSDQLLNAKIRRCDILNNLGVAVMKTDPTSALEYAESAIELAEEVIKVGPPSTELWSQLGGYLQNYAIKLIAAARFGDAIEVLLRALDAQTTAYGINKNAHGVRSHIRIHVDELLALYQMQNDVVSSMNLAKRIEALLANEPKEQGFVASIYWRIYQAAEDSTGAKSKVGLDGAMRCIKRAINSGAENRASLLKDPHLKDLRLEPRFIEIVEPKD